MPNPTLDPLIAPGFLAALDRLSLRTRRQMRSQLLGARRSVRHGASVEFSDFRDYAPGDDLRSIDWKAYGRLDKLLVKLFREEDDLSLHLLLDASLSMTVGGEPEKFLFAKKLCAALGAIALLDSNRCSLSLMSGNATSAAPGTRALRGRSSLPALLSQLNRAQATGNARISSTLTAMAQRPSSPGVLAVVSDFYDHGLTAALLARARRSFDVALVHVATPEEIDPTIMLQIYGEGTVPGEMRFIDSETGNAVELTLGPNAVEAYRQEFALFCDNLAGIARSAGATYTRVSTDSPLQEVVLGTLRAQGVVA